MNEKIALSLLFLAWAFAFSKIAADLLKSDANISCLIAAVLAFVFGVVGLGFCFAAFYVAVSS